MTIDADQPDNSLFAAATQKSRRDAGHAAGHDAGRRFRRLVSGAALAVGLAACSTPGEPTETGDPVPGTADITIDDVGVQDGTEGGLELDNGNVPGTQGDQNLDPYDEQNDLNSDGADEG